MTNTMAKALKLKGDELYNGGDQEGAIRLYDESIAIWRRMIVQDGHKKLAYDLAKTIGKKAAVLFRNNTHGALIAVDDCIEILRQLVDSEGNNQHARFLAMTLAFRAEVLSSININKKASAITNLDEAISIFRRLVKQGCQLDFAQEYVNLMSSKAAKQKSINDLAGALKTHDEIIAFLRHQVEQDGQRELLCELLWRKFKRASLLIYEGCDSEHEHRQVSEILSNLHIEAKKTGELHYIQEAQMEKLLLDSFLELKHAEQDPQHINRKE